MLHVMINGFDFGEPICIFFSVFRLFRYRARCRRCMLADSRQFVRLTEIRPLPLSSVRISFRVDDDSNVSSLSECANWDPLRADPHAFNGLAIGGRKRKFIEKFTCKRLIGYTCVVVVRVLSERNAPNVIERPRNEENKITKWPTSEKTNVRTSNPDARSGSSQYAVARHEYERPRSDVHLRLCAAAFIRQYATRSPTPPFDSAWP